MKTIIEQLKGKLSNDSSENELLDLEEEVEELKEEVEKLEDELEDAITEKDCNVYKTALGKILVYNESGNLQLQQELNDFFELMQQKYL